MSSATPTGSDLRPRFWERYGLDELTTAEWEALCDGCGLCCLVKLEDEDTGQILATRAACRLFDAGSCRCSNYENRKKYVPDCIKVTPENIATFDWFPKSCAYRRVHEGRGLAWWHPLISGEYDSVHRAGVSVRGQVISEEGIADDDLLDYLAPEYDKERGLDDPPQG